MDKHMKFDEQEVKGNAAESTESLKQGVTAIPKALADDKWSKLVNKILAMDTKALRDMHRHV